ncbi:MAG: hypothetical protein LBG87_09295 [Spirochaetaceae bacterium]|jgi:hypothetical protein|nr:hypothetical protein [Spirochaetaceae bacterium]
MAKPKNPADFWREYEERIGERILAYDLGRYIRGWDALDPPLWGLLIVSTGGFRFHHFPHESWMDALSRTASGGDAPAEKTIVIPKERLLGAEFRTETSWWKRLLVFQPPLLLVRCLAESGQETLLTAETEKKASILAERIQTLIQTP